nr:uncharacterized protein LOC113403490 [Vanessa tameamea]
MPEQLSFHKTNDNHSAEAQDLLLQSMAEWQVDLAVACEPYYVPLLPHWLGDSDGTVAVLTRSGTGPPSHSSTGARATLAEFETYLGLVRAAVARQSPKPIMVLGDLNAKSRAWGKPATNPRGRAVQVWALLSDLSLLNRGVVDWRVEEEVETIGPPLHPIRDLHLSQAGGTPDGADYAAEVVSRPGRRSLVKEANIVQRWGFAGRTEGASAEELAGRMRSSLKEVCDVVMPRTRCRVPRRQVYWWSPEIADLWATCCRARRAYVRCRRRTGLDTDLEGQMLDAYRQLKKDLQLAISKAKEKAREELLAGFNRDP